MEPEDTNALPSGVTLGWLEEACADWCALQDACGDGIIDPAACATDCIDGADADGFLASVACAVIGFDAEEPDCELLQLCADPLEPEACAAFCGTVAECGLLGEQTTEFFGTTEVECAIMCGGFGTLTPGGQFEAALECLTPAADACDLMAMMSCIGMTGACDSLCGVDGPTVECGLVPDTWADASACQELCVGWQAGQTIAVQVCVEQLLPDEDPEGSPFGDQGECGAVAAERCLEPPTSLGPGADAFCETIEALCGEASPFPSMLSGDLCGWFVQGFLMAAPPGLFHADFEAAAACVDGLDSCDDGAWLGCFIDPPEEVQGVCETLVDCQDEVELPPGEGFDLQQCVFYLSTIAAQEPDLLAMAIACIDAAEGCQAKFACLGDDER